MFKHDTCIKLQPLYKKQLSILDKKNNVKIKCKNENKKKLKYFIKYEELTTNPKLKYNTFGHREHFLVLLLVLVCTGNENMCVCLCWKCNGTLSLSWSKNQK